MHIKAILLSLFIVGLALANPVANERGDYYEISGGEHPAEQDVEVVSLEQQEHTNEIEPEHDKTELHEKHKSLWASFKEHCHKLYDEVKEKYNEVSHDWEKVKHTATRLIDKSEEIFHDIYAGGKTAVERFELYYNELNSTISKLEKDGSETYEKVSKMLKSFKKDIDEGKIKSKIVSGIKKIVIKGLEGDWDYFRTEWDRISGQVSHLHDIAIEDYYKIKNTTEVVVNGISQDLKDIKKLTLDTYAKIKLESKLIIVEGQEHLQKFEKYYQQLKQWIHGLKPHVGDLFKQIEINLSALAEHMYEFLEIRKKNKGITSKDKPSWKEGAAMAAGIGAALML